MDRTEAARATMTGATLSLGVMSFQVDLISATRSTTNAASDAPKPVSVCPTCTTASPLRQQYYCEAKKHGPFTMKDADKAMTKDGVLTKVSITDVKAVKEKVAGTKSIDLHIFPAGELEAHTMPGGAVYRVRPQRNTKGAQYTAADCQRYALLLQLVADTNLAFVAEVGIKSASRIYRCIAHDGALALVGLVRPEELVPAELVDVPELPEVSEALASTGRHMVEETMESFEPAAWADGIQAGLKDLRDRAEASPEESAASGPGTEGLAKLLQMVA